MEGKSNLLNFERLVCFYVAEVNEMEIHVARRRNGQKEAITGCSTLYNLVIPTDIVRM